MSFRILYYPTMDIPDSSWLKRVLLYSDSIASILPQFEEWKIEHSPILSALQEHGQYRSFDPEEWFLDSNRLEEFESLVLDTFEANEHYRRLKRYSVAGRGRIAGDSRVYASKFTDQIRIFFERNQVAEYLGDNWFYMDDVAAITYLGILARFIAEQNRYTPGTDIERFELGAFNCSSSGEAVHMANMKIYNALPIVDQRVSVEDILNFKREHSTELLRLQQHLLTHQRRIAQANGVQAEINDILEEFVIEWSLMVTQLQQELHDAGIQTRWGSIKTMFNSMVVPSGVSYALSHIPHLPSYISDLGIVAGLANSAITVRHFVVNQQIERRRQMESNPYAYVFHAHQQNLIRRNPH